MEKEVGENSSGVGWNSRGQVTIFIIIALVIVAIAVAIYFFTSSSPASTNAGLDVNNPNGFIQSCLQDGMQQTIKTISLQGGTLAPTQYILFNDSEVSYLCYTSEDYKFCSVQQPFLEQHVESQIENAIKTDVSTCFNSLVQNYKDNGYTTNLQPGNTTVMLYPGKIMVNFSHALTVTKTNTQRYNSFNMVLNNNLYELTSVATSIVNSESIYGDADPNIYMSVYPQIRIHRNIENDSKIYVISDRNSGDTFQFASRSGVIPPGAGFENVATN